MIEGRSQALSRSLRGDILVESEGAGSRVRYLRKDQNNKSRTAKITASTNQLRTRRRPRFPSDLRERLVASVAAMATNASPGRA